MFVSAGNRQFLCEASFCLEIWDLLPSEITGMNVNP